MAVSRSSSPSVHQAKHYQVSYVIICYYLMRELHLLPEPVIDSPKLFKNCNSTVTLTLCSQRPGNFEISPTLLLKHIPHLITKGSESFIHSHVEHMIKLKI